MQPVVSKYVDAPITLCSPHQRYGDLRTITAVRRDLNIKIKGGIG